MKNLIKYLSNLPGWRTERKIVVIESDDWGSIRMPSLQVFDRLKSFGLNIDSGDNKRFNTLDTLASTKDFETLFKTLRKVKDKNGNYPIITALSLQGNPDFEKIEKEGFRKYFYEPFFLTLEKYGQSDTFKMWEQGEEESLFYPEFHGREHLNVKVWMDGLERKDKQTMAAFHHRFWGFKPQNNYDISYQAAFDLDDKSTLDLQKNIVKDGVELFEQIHKRKASFFVPPNGAINQEVIDYSVLQGIKFVSSSKIHKEPLGQKKIKKRYRYLGKKGIDQMLYLTRNCFFEPSFKGKGFSIKDCLNHIDIAFKCKKPAIISTHRVNYVGGLNDQNRIEGNHSLERLLRGVVKTWKDVEFMTSTQLGHIIKHQK